MHIRVENHQQKKIPAKTVSIIVAGGGLLFLLVGILIFFLAGMGERRMERIGGIHIQGEIYRVFRHGGGGGGMHDDMHGGGGGGDVTAYVRFVSGGGQEVIGRSNYSSSGMRRGQSIGIIYNPSDPFDFVVPVPFFFRLIFLLVFGGVGLFITIFGIYLFFKKPKEPKQSINTGESDSFADKRS